MDELYAVTAGIIGAYNRVWEATGERPTEIKIRKDALRMLQAEWRMSGVPTMIHGMKVVEGLTIMPYEILAQGSSSG